MEQYRHELKYLINYREYDTLKLKMAPYFTLDKNAVNGEYLIRSLYFDDYFNSAYEEKYSGVYARKKYRIRIYNYSDRSIKLERKKKLGSYIYKESASLSREEFFCIINGEYDFLLHSDKQLCREFYLEVMGKMMRPRVIVDYDRTPFILDAGTVRITFDRDVRAAIGGFDIFDSTLPVMPAMDPDKLIMEVKFTEFLPQIVKNLVPPHASELVAASKYVMCCDKTAYLYDSSYYADERIIL
jgi:hypothetical protein